MNNTKQNETNKIKDLLKVVDMWIEHARTSPTENKEFWRGFTEALEDIKKEIKK